METEAATPSNSASTFAPGSIQVKAPIPRGHLISGVKASITFGLIGLVIGVLGASSADASIPRDLSRPTFTVGAASDVFAAAPQLKLPSFTEELRAIDERVIAASECVALCELAARVEAHPFGLSVLVTPIGTQDAWGNYRFTSELTTSHNRFGFTGHYWDKEASLYYAKARYYDPFTARFTQSDSFLGNIDDPPSLHRYQYANDNPTMFVDEDGHSATALGAAAGFMWGFGQMVGAGIDDLVTGRQRGTGAYLSMWAQNTIGGAEIGASVDIGIATAGLSLTPGLGAATRGLVGGLAGAGMNSLTFAGGDGKWSTFAENQAVGAGVGAAVGVVPELGAGLAAYGAHEGYKTAQAGAPEVGYTQMALSLAPFLSKEVRNLSFGRMRTVVSEQILPRLNPFNYELARPTATASMFGGGQFPKYIGPNSVRGRANPIGQQGPFYVNESGVARTGRGIVRLDRPGFLEFEGFEIRGARDLSHVPESTLRVMRERGFAGTDPVTGDPLIMHHMGQNPAGPLVEVLGPRHSVWNARQHPQGNAPGVGLSAEQRVAFNQWRVEYWKARAAEELARRGAQ